MENPFLSHGQKMHSSQSSIGTVPCSLHKLLQYVSNTIPPASKMQRGILYEIVKNSKNFWAIRIISEVAFVHFLQLWLMIQVFKIPDCNSLISHIMKGQCRF